MSAPLPTRVGRARWDDHDLHGKALYGDLLGVIDLAQWVALGASGRCPSPEGGRVLTALAITLGITDPHIWPLKVTRVGTAFGRFTTGVACGALLYDSETLGPSTGTRAARFLLDVDAAVGAGAELEAAAAGAIERHGAPGFGVPFRPEDERLAALGRFMRAEGRAGERFWSLLERVAPVVARTRGAAPNIAAGTAAALLDLGFTAEDVTPIAFALMQLPQLANAVEGARQAPEVLRNLPPQTITYRGVPPRKSAKNLGSR